MGLFNAKRHRKAPPDCDGCCVKQRCLDLCFGLWLHEQCLFLRSDESEWCHSMKSEVAEVEKL